MPIYSVIYFKQSYLKYAIIADNAEEAHKNMEELINIGIVPYNEEVLEFSFNGTEIYTENKE